VDVILIRHGARDSNVLSTHGEYQARTAAQALARCELRPTLYLSSTRLPAIQTRDLIADALDSNRAARRATSEALTQKSATPERFENLLRELEQQAIVLSPQDQVVLVGHEGRLSNLLTELTGERARPFEHGGLACVRADTTATLYKGKGVLEFRYPVVDHGEKDLQAKAQSKMGVASFLAGFVFAALIELLLNHADKAVLRAAAVALTLALAMFVGAIYVYDQISMPPGFWTDGPRLLLPRYLADRRERRAEARWHKIEKELGPEAADEDIAAIGLDGPLFDSMVKASRFLFTPAVALSLIGFALIVADVHSSWVRVGAAVSVVAAVGCFLARRPSLGVD